MRLGKFLRKRSGPGPEGTALSCSFCQKRQQAVRKLIAGPGVAICDECVDICTDIIAEEKEVERGLVGGKEAPDSPPDRIPSSPPAACALCRGLVPASECIWVPDRGPLCSICLTAIRAALEDAQYGE